MNNKLVAGLAAIAVLVVAGIIYVNFGPKTSEKADYSAPGPEAVVQQYFESWNRKSWPDMYATLSDGFKRIDPNAKNFATFKSYAESQGVAGVKIIELKTESYAMNGIEVPRDMQGMPDMQAIIAYAVEFTLADGSKKQFSDKFTLKYRDGDIITGWKLIHPYGTNIDTS